MTASPTLLVAVLTASRQLWATRQPAPDRASHRDDISDADHPRNPRFVCKLHEGRRADDECRASKAEL